MTSGGGWTGLGITMEACSLMGIREISEFYALPQATQDLWLGFVIARFRGAGKPALPPSGKGAVMTAEMAAEVRRSREEAA